MHSVHKFNKWLCLLCSQMPPFAINVTFVHKCHPTLLSNVTLVHKCERGGGDIISNRGDICEQGRVTFVNKIDICEWSGVTFVNKSEIF